MLSSQCPYLQHLFEIGVLIKDFVQVFFLDGVHHAYVSTLLGLNKAILVLDIEDIADVPEVTALLIAEQSVFRGLIININLPVHDKV